MKQLTIPATYNNKKSVEPRWNQLTKQIWRKFVRILFHVVPKQLHESFHKLDEIGNNANIGIGGFTTWKQKKIELKILPLVRIESEHLINLTL